MRFKLFNISLLFLIILFLTGCDDKKVEIHHLYPQEFKSFFESKGINVDDYGINLTKELHRGANVNSFHGTQWNKEWRDYIINNKNASKVNLEKQLKQMLENRDFSGRIHYINYRTKQPSGIYADLFGVSMIGFIGKFGNFIIGLFGTSSSIVVFFIWIGTLTLSILGFNTRQEAGFLVGIGFIVVFLILSVTIWIIYPYLYVWLIGIGIIGGVGATGLQSAGD